jgi:TonB family protein
MTLWLSNLAAFSVQLAVLVAAAAAIVTVLRINAPAATLRFWQVLFTASLLSPGYQLRMNLDSSREVFAGGLLWSAASTNAAGFRAGVAALNADVATVLMTVLATGAAIRLGWLGLGLIRLRSIRTASAPAHSLSSIALPLQHALGVVADIRFSDAVTSPATIGIHHPTVLLPRRAQDLAPSLQHAVLSHELIHVRRRDWLPALLEEVWCAILWFHPAARVLASRLSLARETLVDEATIAHTRDRRAYAEALLEFSTARPRLLGANALIGRRHLEQRIALIAQEVSMPRSSLAVRMVVAAGAVALATLVTTSSVPMGATLPAQPEKIYKPGQDTGVTLPRVVREVKPEYTPAAMRARIQGTVWLTTIVLANGDVGDVTVAKSLDAEHGLDQQAIDATRQWKFEPGTREGKPVSVEVTIEMTFTLKK